MTPMTPMNRLGACSVTYVHRRQIVRCIAFLFLEQGLNAALLGAGSLVCEVYKYVYMVQSWYIYSASSL